MVEWYSSTGCWIGLYIALLFSFVLMLSLFNNVNILLLLFFIYPCFVLLGCCALALDRLTIIVTGIISAITHNPDWKVGMLRRIYPAQKLSQYLRQLAQKLRNMC